MATTLTDSTTLRTMILRRIVIGKVMGAVIGGLVFFVTPWLGFEMAPSLRLGVWLMYVMMGAMIGLMGLYDRHPWFGFALPWWVRGPVIGVSFHLLLALLAWEPLGLLMTQVPWFMSPWWVLCDGLIVGALMDWAASEK